ncbi:MAG: UDP-N-acetylglucosamine 1-carboxyvinyltransferase [Bacilli bacterium]
MKQIIINGGHTLSKTVKISGAKNSAVALVPAALLCDEIATISNIPNISDISVLTEILQYLNVKISRKENIIKIDTTNIINKEIPQELSQKLRASYYFMGALLGKFKKVKMYFPGGCCIGKRPINLHLKGFEALGAVITEQENYYTIEASKLTGAHIYLDVASVGATINIMLAATKAKGQTIIENAAKEPEIANISAFLNNMGANIIGAGTNRIIINGVKKLTSSSIKVIPDRIEAGTYTLIGAIIGKNLKITNIIPEHIEALLIKLKEMEVPFTVNEDYLTISSTDQLKPINVTTLGYPGFPTDLQQPLTTLLTMCKGTSLIQETVYENRFQNVEYLNEMGSNIQICNDKIKITGPTTLLGCTVKATDLRAGACLILAGLKASGQTVITDIEHVLRGYENIIIKLQKIGAKIEIEEI